MAVEGVVYHPAVPLSTIAFYYQSYSTPELLNELLKDQIDQSDVPQTTTIET